MECNMIIKGNQLKILKMGKKNNFNIQMRGEIN